jgi:hypothetical protein
MSLTQNTPPSEVVFAGPLTYQAAGAATTGWVQVAGAVTTQQNLVVGASGASGAVDYTQPCLPPFGGFWHEHLVIKVTASGIVSWVATASTTMTWAFGVTGTSQGSTTGVPAGSPITLFTSQAFPNNSTAQSNIPWRFEMEWLVRQVGFGTTAVSTSVLATGVGGFTAATVANSVWGPQPPTVTTTVDSSANNYVWGAITFGTNGSSSNTCTMLDMIVQGLN